MLSLKIHTINHEKHRLFLQSCSPLQSKTKRQHGVNLIFDAYSLLRRTRMNRSSRSLSFRNPKPIRNKTSETRDLCTDETISSGASWRALQIRRSSSSSRRVTSHRFKHCLRLRGPASCCRRRRRRRLPESTRKKAWSTDRTWSDGASGKRAWRSSCSSCT